MQNKYLLLLPLIFVGLSCFGQVSDTKTKSDAYRTSEHEEITPNLNEMEGYKKITWKELDAASIRLIEDWMLVAAGNIDDYNMMTANWGTLGYLWRKPVATIYVRPQRHTHNYTEREDYFTLTFFTEDHRGSLELMGEVSGRDFDKMNYENLRPVVTPNGSIGFREAYMIIECKKLYSTVLKEEDFSDKRLMRGTYPRKDFHTVYVGEITGIWVKE
jgi:flavin reductase (DIM6/NTAB) family NADH-FMN oxidoreductase RutF